MTEKWVSIWLNILYVVNVGIYGTMNENSKNHIN